MSPFHVRRGSGSGTFAGSGHSGSITAGGSAGGKRGPAGAGGGGSGTDGSRGTVADISSTTASRRRGSSVASSSSPSLHRQSFRETAKVVKRKLDNGNIIINKYQILSELGKGSYGSVHLCRDGETGMVSGGEMREIWKDVGGDGGGSTAAA